MKVVSNSSPLIFLGKIHRLALLSECFGQIEIPETVHEELSPWSPPHFVSIRTLSPEGHGFVEGALGRLHRGELGAMRLAIEQKADLLLLDDLIARRKATRMGLKIMGTVGVLFLAHHKSLLGHSEVLNALHDLRYKHHLYISDALMDRLITELKNCRPT